MSSGRLAQQDGEFVEERRTFQEFHDDYPTLARRIVKYIEAIVWTRRCRRDQDPEASVSRPLDVDLHGSRMIVEAELVGSAGACAADHGENQGSEIVAYVAGYLSRMLAWWTREYLVGGPLTTGLLASLAIPAA